jgi:hypothetical protein
MLAPHPVAVPKMNAHLVTHGVPIISRANRNAKMPPDKVAAIVQTIIQSIYRPMFSRMSNSIPSLLPARAGLTLCKHFAQPMRSGKVRFSISTHCWVWAIECAANIEPEMVTADTA